MNTYRVRVTHVYQFFSFYEIEAVDINEAEKEAKQKFKKDFCNAATPISMLSAFTLNKYR